MIITFNELRRIKDRLPSGSSQRIADELGIDVDTVRNYFGGKHESKECVGVHFEPGPDGGHFIMNILIQLSQVVSIQITAGAFDMKKAMGLIMKMKDFIL